MEAIERPLPYSEGAAATLTRDDWITLMRGFVHRLSGEDLADLAAIVWIERTRPGRVMKNASEGRA